MLRRSELRTAVEMPKEEEEEGGGRLCDQGGVTTAKLEAKSECAGLTSSASGVCAVSPLRAAACPLPPQVAESNDPHGAPGSDHSSGIRPVDVRVARRAVKAVPSSNVSRRRYLHVPHHLL